VGIFSRSKKPESVPLTRLDRVREHQRLAEDLLARSAKGGRLEADTRWATMATAHATLAVSYLLWPEEGSPTAGPASSFGNPARPAEPPSEPLNEVHTVHRISSDRGLYEEERPD
jgi:hypothetical protein